LPEGGVGDRYVEYDVPRPPVKGCAMRYEQVGAIGCCGETKEVGRGLRRRQAKSAEGVPDGLVEAPDIVAGGAVHPNNDLKIAGRR
jgi:hypothetical protein